MAKTKKSLIPKSKAKTAYGLLSEVCDVITAEPKRYDQSSFVIRESESNWRSFVSAMPRCGTVGCVAGWVATLKGPAHFDYGATAGIAQTILGIDNRSADFLFSPGRVRGMVQSKFHAANGVKHIRRFQKKYAAQLKAKRV